MKQPDPPSDSPLNRFQQSLQISHEKWHDGVGYDLDAIREADPQHHLLRAADDHQV